MGIFKLDSVKNGHFLVLGTGPFYRPNQRRKKTLYSGIRLFGQGFSPRNKFVRFDLNGQLNFFHCGHGTQFKNEVDNHHILGAKLYVGSQLQTQTAPVYFLSSYLLYI